MTETARIDIELEQTIDKLAELCEWSKCQLCGQEIREVLDGPSNLHRLIIHHYGPWGNPKEFKSYHICDECFAKIKKLLNWEKGAVHDNR